MNAGGVISRDEIAQYDRQIRLWGLDAQKRLRQADVLILGVGGLGAEVVKNIVLAGVRSITLMDWRPVADEDLLSQLLVTPEHLGDNIAAASLARTQELNPNVIVKAEVGRIEEKSPEFFDQFHVVCLTRCRRSEREHMNKICREKKVKFFCGDVYGFFGYFFSDLGTHEYVVEIPSKAKHSPAKKAKLEDDTTVTVKKKLEFCDYKQALAEDWSKRGRREMKHSSPVFFIVLILDEFEAKHGKLPGRGDYQELNFIKNRILAQHEVKSTFVSNDFAKFSLSILSPVAAIVAGVLGQEIIKAISMKDPPHRNFFFFDGVNHCGIVDDIGNAASGNPDG